MTAKPCPDCGRKPELHTSYLISCACPNCYDPTEDGNGSLLCGWGESANQAVEDWNRRVTDLEEPESEAETAERRAAFGREGACPPLVDWPNAPPSIIALIERSSLGTPEAKALREQTPKHVVDAVLRRLDELEAGKEKP